MDNNIFTTQAGQEITVRPGSPLLVDKVRSSIRTPEAPTYEERIELPGQEPIINHVPMKSRDQAKKPEEELAWDRYEVELAKAKAEESQRMFDAMVIPAIIPDLKLPDDAMWEKIHKHLGLEIPEDEFEKKVHYLKFELIKTVDDLTGLIVHIMRATGIDEEKVEQASASFRNSLSGNGAK